MMKAQIERAAKPNVHQQCVTPEYLQKKGFLDSVSGADSRCQQKVISQTSSLVDATVTCADGQRTANGRMRIEVLTPESVKGTMTSQAAQTDGPGAMTMNATFTAKWVAASCGDAK